MTENTNTNDTNDVIQELFSVGAHIGYSRARSHPSMFPFIYGRKAGREIIDLTQTVEKLEDVASALREVVGGKKTVLFVGGKSEAREAIIGGAEKLGMPYVSGRWIGGTITNFKQIRKQIDKLVRLREEKEKGDLTKYTKREQLSFDREIVDLENYYDGLVSLTDIPAALVVIDPKHEQNAVHEARVKGIPVYAIGNTDSHANDVTDVIPANDSAKAAIDLLMGMLTDELAKITSAKESGGRAETGEQKTKQASA